MLFRPSADQNLIAIHATLDAWNAEADRFRQAAIAAQHGETPDPLTAIAAEEVHDGLMSVLDEIDAALVKVPAGSPQFAGLLQAQNTAIALLESVGRSYEILDRFVPPAVTGPVRIAHDLRIAAE